MSAYPLFCWIILAAFLGCLSLFALAVTKVVAPNGDGGQGHSRGFFGGLAALVALLFFGSLGVAGLGAALVAIGVGSAVEWNPIRRIEVHRSAPGEARLESAPREHHDDALHARLTVRGDAGGELVDLLRDLVDVDASELEDALSVHRQRSEQGREFDVYEFRLPLTERDLARFEREVERELDGLKLNLPESIDIRFQGAD